MPSQRQYSGGTLASRRPRAWSASDVRDVAGRRDDDAAVRQRRRRVADRRDQRTGRARALRPAPRERIAAPAPPTPNSACVPKGRRTDTLARSTNIARRLRSVSARSAATSARNDDCAVAPEQQRGEHPALGRVVARPLDARPAARRFTSFDSWPCRNASASGPAKGQERRSGRSAAKRRGGLVRRSGGGTGGRWNSGVMVESGGGAAERAQALQGYRSGVASGAETVLE